MVSRVCFSFDRLGVSPYHRAPMSAGTLPQQIDAQKWADREAEIKQVFSLAAFPRVQEIAVEEAGEVSVFCRVSRDAQHRMQLQGNLTAKLALRCQRCLEAVTAEADTEFSLLLVRSEEDADRLADDADFLVLDEEGQLALADAIEDELLLALPMVPLHDDCEAAHRNVPVEEEANEAPRRENPFQVLAALKAGTDEK